MQGINNNNNLNNNPYSAPDMDSLIQEHVVEDMENHFGLLSEPRKLDASFALDWLSKATNIIKEDTPGWLLSGLLAIIVYAVCSVIPILIATTK